jgi:hypothetical protein
MSILDSSIAPYLTILVILAVLGGFFRKTLIRVLIIVGAEIILLALFPRLAEALLRMVAAVHGFLT